MRTSEARTVRIDITSMSLVRIGLFASSVWLLTELWDVVLLVTMALIFAGTLSPFVEALERRVSRAWAVAAVVFSLLAIAAGIEVLTIPPLVSQAAEIVKQVPDLLRHVADRMQHVRALSRLSDEVRDLDVASIVKTYAGNVLKVSTAAAGTIGYAVSTLVLSIYFLADPLQAKSVLFALVPRSYHVRTSRILLKLETIVGGYMRGQAITSAAITAFLVLLLWICGVPNPLPLAVFAGIADVIPLIGGVLVLVPSVLSALSQGVGTTIVVAVAILIYQEFENRLLAPRVYGHMLRLRPVAVIVALLVGGKLMGILGALLALPIASAMLMIIEELRVELPGTPGSSPRYDREHHSEVLYAERAAGTNAEEAARIADSIVAAETE
jgi:predicted PurR-regulated permease PerM